MIQPSASRNDLERNHKFFNINSIYLKLNKNHKVININIINHKLNKNHTPTWVHFKKHTQKTGTREYYLVMIPTEDDEKTSSVLFRYRWNMRSPRPNLRRTAYRIVDDAVIDSAIEVFHIASLT